MSSLLLSLPPRVSSSLSSTPSYHGSPTPACWLLYFVVEIALTIFVVVVVVVSVVVVAITVAAIAAVAIAPVIIQN